MAKGVRSNTEIVSQLRIFGAQRSKDFPGWIIVTCPHCEGVFLVKASIWFKKRVGFKGTVLIGRSCPYCYATSRLPDRRSIR